MSSLIESELRSNVRVLETRPSPLVITGDFTWGRGGEAFPWTRQKTPITQRTIGFAAAGQAMDLRLIPWVGSAWSQVDVPVSDTTEAAVAITRLERRGNRVWGIPCVGTRAASGGLGAVPFREQIKLPAISNGPIGEFAAGALYFAADQRDIRIFGEVDNRLELRIDGQWRVADGLVGASSHQVNHFLPGVRPSIAWRAINTGGFAGGGFAVTGTVGSSESPPYDWRPVVGTLRYVVSGLPWWGAIDAAARAGRWVRRSGWTDQNRAVRFVAGAGTTRAVAVRETGERVTTADFTSAEWTAQDWVVVDGEPVLVDVTDAVLDLHRRGGGVEVQQMVLFAAGPSIGGGGGATPTDPITGTPITGDPGSSGFLYRKSDGTTILVPGADCSGTTYAP
jgi:hypothetical protein